MKTNSSLLMRLQFLFQLWGIALAFSNLPTNGAQTNSQRLPQDYRTHPNMVDFTLRVKNNYLATGLAPVQVVISQGTPTQIAVLVDSNDYDNALWKAYSGSNLTVNLGTTSGWHEVWIGLKDSATNSQPTWQWVKFKVVNTPPRFVITNSTTTVSESMIQIMGYTPEPVAQISCTISNSENLLINHQVLVLDRSMNTSGVEFTTNYFQVFDVHLALGTNSITFYATDVVGHTATTNIDFILVRSTNAPDIKLDYPHDRMKLSGDKFDIVGRINDPSAHLTANIFDANGNMNSREALIERNGKFWIEEVPLRQGKLNIYLLAWDRWGNTSITNFTVTPSNFVLTVNKVDPKLLFGGTITLTGTVGNSTYTIWANGVQGKNNGDGTWIATNVPINEGGTASFRVAAFPKEAKLVFGHPGENPTYPNDPK